MVIADSCFHCNALNSDEINRLRRFAAVFQPEADRLADACLQFIQTFGLSVTSGQSRNTGHEKTLSVTFDHHIIFSTHVSKFVPSSSIRNADFTNYGFGVLLCLWNFLCLVVINIQTQINSHTSERGQEIMSQSCANIYTIGKEPNEKFHITSGIPNIPKE